MRAHREKSRAKDVEAFRTLILGNPNKSINFRPPIKLFNAGLPLLLLSLVANPPVGKAAILFDTPLSWLGAQWIPLAPSLPSDFKMNVLVRSWFEKHVISCTLAYSRRGRGMGNLLYVNCQSEKINSTKFYAFHKDTLLQQNGKSGEMNIVNEIPESEKHDPYFPVEFHNEKGDKVFDNPDSLIHFTGENKRPAQDSDMQENDWTSDATVTFQGHTEKCVNHLRFTRKNAVSPYCDGGRPARVHCPLVPMDSTLLCEDGHRIHYSFSDYVEEWDPSIFKRHLEMLEIGIVTKKLPTPSVLSPDPLAGGLSPAIMAAITLPAVALALIPIVIGICLVLRRPQKLRAQEWPPRDLCVYSENATESLIDKSNLPIETTRSNRQVHLTENGATALNTVITSEVGSTSSCESGISSSKGDPQATRNAQREKSSACLMNSERMQLFDDEASDLVAPVPRSPDSKHRQPSADIAFVRDETHPDRSDLLDGTVVKKKAEFPSLRLETEKGPHGSMRSRVHKVPYVDRATKFQEPGSSPPSDADSAQIPLLKDPPLDVPG